MCCTRWQFGCFQTALQLVPLWLPELRDSATTRSSPMCVLSPAATGTSAAATTYRIVLRCWRDSLGCRARVLRARIACMILASSCSALKAAPWPRHIPRPQAMSCRHRLQAAMSTSSVRQENFAANDFSVSPAVSARDASRLPCRRPARSGAVNCGNQARPQPRPSQRQRLLQLQQLPPQLLLPLQPLSPSRPPPR